MIDKNHTIIYISWILSFLFRFSTVHSALVNVLSRNSYTSSLKRNGFSVFELFEKLLCNVRIYIFLFLCFLMSYFIEGRCLKSVRYELTHFIMTDLQSWNVVHSDHEFSRILRTLHGARAFLIIRLQFHLIKK